MNYGRYFSYDKEISDPTTGYIVFNYRRIRKCDRKEANTPEFPVYVYINPHAIYFKIHISEKEMHGHFDLFTIPLQKGMLTDSSFTEMLRKAYDSTFPCPPDENRSTSQQDENELMSYLNEGIDKAPEKQISYSTLDVFNREKDKKSYYLLRKLILDFLYDLDHTSAFDLSPYSHALVSNLCENHLFNAILRKARFYYYRQLMEDENIRKLVFTTFLQKAKDWNAVIRYRYAELIFHYSGWCMGVEKEMLDMFRLKEGARAMFRVVAEKNETWTTLRLLSVNWFLKRYSFSKALLLLLFPQKTERRKKINYAGLSFIAVLTLVSLHYPFLSLYILPLFLGIFGFMWAKKGKTTLIAILPRLAAIILSAWIVTIFNTDLLRCFFDVRLNFATIAILLAILAVTIILFMAESQKVNLFSTLKSRFFNSLYIILVGLFYSVTSGIILSSLTCKQILGDPAFLQKFYTKELYENDNIRIKECYPFIARTFLNEKIGKENIGPYIRQCQEIITHHPVLMQRFEAKAAALPDISFEPDAFKENPFFQIPGNRQKLLYILSLDILNDPPGAPNNRKSLYHTLYYMPALDIACPALFKKLFQSELSSECYFEGLQYVRLHGNCVRSDLLVERYLPVSGKQFGIKVRYFPGFLILFTFISIFLSIFLQVIIDDKKVTETF